MSTSIERWTAALLLAAVLFPGPPVFAQERLACGETISRELAAGALHRFSFVVAEGESVAVDLFEISNDEGGSVAYRVSDELGVIDEACEDDEVIGFELFDLDAGAYDLEVFLCDPRASARYSLTLAGTSATFAGEDSCGKALSCSEPTGCSTACPEHEAGPPRTAARD